jgi:uncharacterized surface protein with fasciclin (FAS1) repeats
VSLADSGADMGEFRLVSQMLRESSWFASMLAGSPFTILATSDSSLREMDPELLASISDPEELDSIVGFHVLPGKLTAEQLAKFTRIETIGGQRLHVTNWNGELEVAGSGSSSLEVPPARIIQADILVGDGMLHLLDGFAIPATRTMGEQLAESGTAMRFQGLMQVAGLSGLLDERGPMTLFVPTDAAFDELDPATAEQLLDPDHKDGLRKLLKRHMVPGRLYADQFHTGELGSMAADGIEFTWSSAGFFVEGARIVHTDTEATNGVVHLIDRVLVD